MKRIEIVKAISQPELTVLDIGARGGIQPRWARLIENYPATVYGFDPDVEHCEKLNQEAAAGVKYLPYAIHSGVGKKDFHVTAGDQNGSFMRHSDKFLGRFSVAEAFRVTRSIPLEVADLDSVMARCGIADVDHVKIDTEGCEAEILAGAAVTLSQAVSLEVEVWFNNIHERAPLFSELDLMVRKHGFILFDVEQSNYFKRTGGQALSGRKGQLIAGDALYFREFSPAWSRDKAIKAVLVVMQYGYLDFAWELVTEAGKSGAFSDAETGAMKEFVTANRAATAGIESRPGLKAMLKSWFPVLARRKELGN